MDWRANDVCVGVITGVCSAVFAALFEASIVAERFLLPGAFSALEGKFAIIALAGAVVGGVVGCAVGAATKPRRQTH